MAVDLIVMLIITSIVFIVIQLWSNIIDMDLVTSESLIDYFAH